MGKQVKFSCTSVEVCRHCRGEGRVEEETVHGTMYRECQVCCGSGMVTRHAEGTVTLTPHRRKTPV